jgi:hypothetical protein
MERIETFINNTMPKDLEIFYKTEYPKASSPLDFAYFKSKGSDKIDSVIVFNVKLVVNENNKLTYSQEDLDKEEFYNGIKDVSNIFFVNQKTVDNERFLITSYFKKYNNNLSMVKADGWLIDKFTFDDYHFIGDNILALCYEEFNKNNDIHTLFLEKFKLEITTKYQKSKFLDKAIKEINNKEGK